MIQVASGIYLPTSTWAALSLDERYLARVHAIALAYDRELVFSHLSASALWRLPMVGTRPYRAEVLVPRSTGGRSRQTLLAHGDGTPTESDLVLIDGLIVTGLARTVVDVGRTALLGTAVAMADRALAQKPWNVHGLHAVSITPEQLTEVLAAHPSERGRATCGLVLQLASGLSGSPGESVSRVGMHLLGLPAPILQHQFSDDLGNMFVDFWWPEFGLVGEFDGRGKYLREEYLRGITTADALIKEKDREDRIRALGPGFVRWGWNVAMSLPRLDAKLRKAGLR